jgi:hypothetical protein
MRFAASQGSGTTCAVVGSLSLAAGLPIGASRKSPLKTSATSDGDVPAVVEPYPSGHRAAIARKLQYGDNFSCLASRHWAYDL